MVSRISPTFPHTSIDISFHAATLPTDGSVPGMPDWKWIHTPGHTDGHISVFREKDSVLIAADAFSTTKQKFLYSVLTQDEKIRGPPAYLTTDWKAAKDSIEYLRDLKPKLVITSHGELMKGDEVTQHFEFLVNNFDETFILEQGRFVNK